MYTRCEDCGRAYDDAHCFTVCPHQPLSAGPNPEDFCKRHDLYGPCPMCDPTVPRHKLHPETAARVSEQGQLQMAAASGKLARPIARQEPDQSPKRLSEEELARLLEGAPMTGDLYIHKKTGHRYLVLLSCLQESDHKVLVAYRRLGLLSPIWARPLPEFQEKFVILEKAADRRDAP